VGRRARQITAPAYSVIVQHGGSALVFDAYGTLFDVASVAEACAEVAREPGALVSLWRAKQLEYSFLRALMGPAAYVDFWSITADALDFAAEKLGLKLSSAERERALHGWLEVRAYPEVEATLETLASDGRRCVILSNGSPNMLHAALTSAGQAVLSVDAVRTFKPHPRVYQMALDALATPPGDVLFLSSNGWDAAGARAFGLPVGWVNRTGAPVERLGFSPDMILPDLSALPPLLRSVAR
jgi:2-haloacid dehalogenase